MTNRRHMVMDTEGMISLLQDNLRDRYRDCFSIIQELLQNADDAGNAKSKSQHVHFGISKGIDVDCPLLNGPALFVVNDGPVSPSDLDAIFRVAAGNKRADENKIGKFGLGMKSVFHVCEGFFMYGAGLECQEDIPCFCTPWSEDFHKTWWDAWESESELAAKKVAEVVRPVVSDWDRWFCVWIPMRREEQLEGISPIQKKFPDEQTLIELTGVSYSERASRMLPLLKNITSLSFGGLNGEARRYEMEASGRLHLDSGELSGSLTAYGPGATGYRFCGKAVLYKGDETFTQLQSLKYWPESTHKERLRESEKAERIEDKTKPHAAVCILIEDTDDARVSVSPCVFLPLSGPQERREEYSMPIQGHIGLTIYLHGNMFVDAGRQDMKVGQIPVQCPTDESTLRLEWNRRLFVCGLLPLLIPEIARTLDGVDQKTAEAIMSGLPKIEWLAEWMPEICSRNCLVSEMTPDGYAWRMIPSSNKIYSLPRPRSKIIHKVLCAILADDSDSHVINAEAGRLVKPDSVSYELPEDVCARALEYIAEMPYEESDNEVLRQFAQDCASRLDFASLSIKLQNADIWKIGSRRCSYRTLKELADERHLYCHAEGELKKIFEEAVEWYVVQVNEPLVQALKLDVPDFSERFVLDVLQKKPQLFTAEKRQPLLAALLQKRALHGEYEWFKACRYLAHGEPDLFDCDEPLFMPLNDEFSDISKKMVDALARSRYGACCRLPEVITKSLTPANQEELKLPMSKADNLVLAFSALESFEDVEFAENDWQALVMMVPNALVLDNVKAALKRIPAFPTISGELTAITERVFLTNAEFAVPAELRHCVKLLKVEGDDLAAVRLKHLSTVWNPNDCIRISNKENLDHAVLARIFKDCLIKFNEYISPDVKQILMSRCWVDLKDGRVVSPDNVLTIGEMSDLVPGCVTNADVLDGTVAGLLQKHSLSVGASSSVEMLFTRMAADPNRRFLLGRFVDSDGTNKVIDAYTLVRVMTGAGEEHLPVITVLNRLSGRHIKYATYIDKLRGGLSDKQLVAIIQIVTSAIADIERKDENVKLFSLLYSYLDEAAALGNFMRDIVPQLRFFNRNGALKRSRDVCFGVDGIPDKFILFDGYKDAVMFIDSIKQTALSRQRSGFDRQVSFKDYFAAWDPEFADRIGGFIVCCSDQSAELDLARSRYGFEVRSIEEARNGVWPELNSFLRNQHCYILATPEEKFNVISVSGETMEVSATLLDGADSLFCGQFNTCEYVRNSVLEMSMGNPPMPKEDHSLILRLRMPDAATMADRVGKMDDLLKKTLEIILDTYHIQNPEIDQFWESLKHSEQLAVRVTKSIILQSLNTYLPMINCKDEGLKETFSKWHDLAYSEAEAEQHGHSSKVAVYRDQRAGLQRDLEQRIATDATLSEAILTALRAKMQDYQYDIDSMLFELFQNADDATEELHDMFGSDSPELPDRFCVRYDGNNLIVAHWGRPINQTKVGIEANPKYAVFRADLQKMLMLSQSGKGRADIRVSGKFGLGFKTVFLVCDKPYVVSGKLKFKILGGLLPEPLDDEEDAQIRYLSSEFYDTNAVVKPTVFVLPLRNAAREKVSGAVARFARQVDVLSAFSRRIKEISVIRPDGVEVLARKGNAPGLRMLKMEHAQFLIGEENGRLEPLDKDVATYWVTAPTEMRAELGIALNADFDLDPGRSYLNLRSEKNASLLPRIAEELYNELIRLYGSMEDGPRKAFFGGFFDIVAGRARLDNWREDGSHASAKAMREVFWSRSTGAYLRLLHQKPVIPSGLSGELDELCRLDEVERMVSKAITDSELVKLIPPGELVPGKVVTETNLMKLGMMFFPEKIRCISLYTVKNLIEDLRDNPVCQSPEWCAGEGARIILSALSNADKDVVEALQAFRFKTKAGVSRCVTELLIADEHEGLKAAFMPPEYVLSGEYGEQGIEFVKFCRGERRVKARVLAAQAATTTDIGQQIAVLKYLANGNPSDEFKVELRKARNEGWLADWAGSEAARKLTRREKDRVADALAVDEAEYIQSMFDAWGTPPAPDSPEPPTVARAPISIRAVRDWWRIHAEEELKDYNLELYDQPVVEDLSFDLDSPNARKAWMQVLVLGAAHALGMKNCQHKGFIAELVRRGYWDVYCKRDLQASEWLDTIDDFLDNEELNGGKYNYWRRLFFRIYQFSKNLDVYVQLFKSWNWAKECAAPDLAAIKTNAALSGSGIDAPGFQKALSLTGIHFVFREMVRRHAIRNPLIYPQCFVPYEKVSEVAWNVRVSAEIYRKIVAEIGEQDATFDGAFDIALTQYDKHGREE